MEIIQILVCFLHGKPSMVNTQILSQTLLINNYLLWKQEFKCPSSFNPNHLNTARARGGVGKRSGNEVRLGIYIVKLKDQKKW